MLFEGQNLKSNPMYLSHKYIIIIMIIVTSSFSLIQHNRNLRLFRLGSVRISQAALCHDLELWDNITLPLKIWHCHMLKI